MPCNKINSKKYETKTNCYVQGGQLLMIKLCIFCQKTFAIFEWAASKMAGQCLTPKLALIISINHYLLHSHY